MLTLIPSMCSFPTACALIHVSLECDSTFLEFALLCISRAFYLCSFFVYGLFVSWLSISIKFRGKHIENSVMRLKSSKDPAGKFFDWELPTWPKKKCGKMILCCVRRGSGNGSSAYTLCLLCAHLPIPSQKHLKTL